MGVVSMSENDNFPSIQRLTDAGSGGGYFSVEAEDVWSCSEPDINGRVRAVVNLGGVLLSVEGRRIFNVANP